MSINLYDGLYADNTLQSLLDPNWDQFSFNQQGDSNSLNQGGNNDGLHIPGLDSSLDLTGQSHAFGLGLGSSSIVPATGFDFLGNYSLDAKGGGGTHGGGGSSGGGGGGSGGGGGGNTLLTEYTSSGPTNDASQDFNVHVNFNGSGWTSDEQAVVKWAADFVSSIITGDVRNDIDLNGNPVDDVTIDMSIGNIDRGGHGAAGNVLAQTQVEAVRDPGSIDQWLPVTSSTTLDSFDLSNSTNEGLQGSWDYLIVHEMLHAVGFYGYIFDQLGLTDANGNFIGQDAVAAYNNGSSVPLSNDGGTASGSHWSETAFMPDGQHMSNELMTQYVTNYSDPALLSDVTVAALHDLGYQVQDPDPNASTYLVDSGLLIA